MKLKLHNFRCYEDAEFDFGNEGLTLISGASGKGKSTIMMAIEFALFGSGNKLQTYGKRGCSVELMIENNFKVFRQKGPNRLIVNDEFEDDAGESIIKQRFGTSMLSCYIPQNIRKTFILMSPAERLEFLESLVMSSVNVTEIKNKTKALIKKLGDEQTETLGSLRAMDITLKTVEKPTSVQFPIKVSKENMEKAEKNEIIKNKNAKIMIRKTEERLAQLTSLLSESKVVGAVIDEKTKRVKSIEEELEKLESEHKQDHDIYEETTLREAMSKLKLLIQNKSVQDKIKEFENSKRQLEELKKEEHERITCEISNIETWVDMSRVEAIEQAELWNLEYLKLQEFRSLMKRKIDVDALVKSRDLLKIEIQNTMSEIETRKKALNDFEFQKTVYSCPHCSSKLKFSDSGLQLTEHVSTSKIIDVDAERWLLEHHCIKRLNELTTKLQKKERIIEEQETIALSIKEIGDVDQDAEVERQNINTYIDENIKKENKLEKLKKSLLTPSPAIFTLEKKNSILEKEIATFPVQTPMSESEEDLRKCISKQESAKIVFELYKKTHSSLTLALKEAKRQLDDAIIKRSLISSIEQIEDEIQSCKGELESFKEKYDKTSKTLGDIEKYHLYIQKYEQWKQLIDQRTLLAKQEETLRSRYAAACTFKEKILEAESMSIANTINTINTHAQVFLDHFFPDDPITIRLVPFKETKESQKPQINIEIEYKGIEHDISMLSGGEMSRVVLAFTLALAEIHDTPFVMLDESTASLDQELTCSVMEGLTENFGNKLVLVVAHQVVQGAFNNIVKLD